MPMTHDPLVTRSWAEAADDVIQAGQQAAQRGWVPATAGNLSVRCGLHHIAITRTGCDKGQLTVEHLLHQNLSQPLLPGSSAEAALHTRLYADFPDTQAVFHVHHPLGAVLGQVLSPAAQLVLQGWELLKALPGIRTHETQAVLPIFANTQDIATLAEQVSARFRREDAAALVPGYLIAGHGLYTWGDTPALAWRHLEALDALLQQEVQWRQLTQLHAALPFKTQPH